MPSNFYHDGYSYIDEDGNRQSEHPNIEKLIEIFIKDENAKIAEYTLTNKLIIYCYSEHRKKLDIDPKKSWT